MLTRDDIETLRELINTYVVETYLAGVQHLDLADAPACQQAKVAVEMQMDKIVLAAITKGEG